MLRCTHAGRVGVARMVSSVRGALAHQVDQIFFLMLKCLHGYLHTMTHRICFYASQKHTAPAGGRAFSVDVESVREYGGPKLSASDNKAGILIIGDEILAGKVTHTHTTPIYACTSTHT
jgi:hypothetical protein